MRDMADYERKLTGEDMDFERYQEHFRRNTVKKMIDMYIPEGSSILEIGCGLKPLFVDYHDEYKFTVVEPADSFYKNAECLAENYKNVVCYQGFMEDIVEEMKGCTFDFIICTALLHEVVDPKRLLRVIHSLCSQKTIVHVSTLNAFSLHRLLAKEMGLMEDVHQLSETNQILQQSAVFDMKSLKQLVSDEHFQILDAGSFFLKPFSQKQMKQCMDHEILNHDVLDALDSICSSYMKEYGSEIYLNIQRED